jgi:hypothetical protein
MKFKESESVIWVFSQFIPVFEVSSGPVLSILSQEFQHFHRFSLKENPKNVN